MSDGEEAEVSAWLAEQAERTIETACARVFLGPERALKIKRRLNLGYLDFSSLELRRGAVERELEFNRATAPDIYRAVHAITREADGSLALDGEGAVVEYALEMRRFDDGAVLSAQPEALTGEVAEALGRTIARSHMNAALRPDGGGAAGLRYTVESNAGILRELAPRLGAALTEQVLAATEAALSRQAGLLDRRREGGFARRCHADLHLGNILLENGRPVLFDCLEFNDRLSDTDVQYDLAFLLMDLDVRGRRDAAVRVLSAYLDEAGRGFNLAEVVAGLAALPLMLAVRAAVRAHVSAHSGDDAAARRYLQAAAAHLSPEPPRLAAVGGYSGSGKSTFARAAAPLIGPAPGAAILRTDEIRKRLAGIPADAALPPESYTSEAQTAVYEAMLAQAEALLKVGRSVVLDATFIDAGLRDRAEAVAAQAKAPFAGAWLEAPEAVLAERVADRRGDASDATPATLQRQVAAGAGEIGWTRVDACRPAKESAAAWVAGLSGTVGTRR